MTDAFELPLSLVQALRNAPRRPRTGLPCAFSPTPPASRPCSATGTSTSVHAPSPLPCRRAPASVTVPCCCFLAGQTTWRRFFWLPVCGRDRSAGLSAGVRAAASPGAFAVDHRRCRAAPAADRGGTARQPERPGGTGADNAPELLAVDGLDPLLASSWHAPELQRDDIAFLQYTSGSTALPKGVQVSHGNLVANEQLIRQALASTSTPTM